MEVNQAGPLHWGPVPRTSSCARTLHSTCSSPSVPRTPTENFVVILYAWTMSRCLQFVR